MGATEAEEAGLPAGDRLGGIEAERWLARRVWKSEKSAGQIVQTVRRGVIEMPEITKLKYEIQSHVRLVCGSGFALLYFLQTSAISSERTGHG